MFETKNTKDSVFIDLFCEDEVVGKENFLSLYNALHDTNLTLENTRLKRFTLDKTLYQKQVNDISMLVNDRLIVLMEHQSTVNNNMPLRMLMYVARLYEKIVPAIKRYQNSAYPIPSPEFYVFYNGKTKLPAESILRLSDAFIESTTDEKEIKTREKGASKTLKQCSEKPKDFPLDLCVKVVNINSNVGNRILEKCEPLASYSRLVEQISMEYNLDHEDYIERAINLCIRERILDSYLKRKGSEVRNMFMVEYDYDEDIAANREEARAEGATNAREDAARKLIAKGMDLELIADVVDLPLSRVQELAEEAKS